MKHVFIVNPAAGKVRPVQEIRSALEALGDSCEYELYETKAPLDATAYVKNWIAEHPGEEVRFYACGGDGTLSEVANGAACVPHASVTCYPCGSGDDFVKYYGGREVFLDLEKLMNAKDESIDLIDIGGRYSINVVNFGFDTKVAKTMIKVKRRKILGGKRAYVTGVVNALLTAMKNTCLVKADGEVLNPKGKMLLCTLACGSYVGGSFYCAPNSDNHDGKIDVTLFTPLSRFTFVKLLPVYTKGEHLDTPKFAKYIHYRRAETIEVEAPEGFSISVDGEIVDGTSFTIRVAPGALRFAVPDGAKLIGARTGEIFGETPCAEEAPAEV